MQTLVDLLPFKANYLCKLCLQNELLSIGTFVKIFVHHQIQTYSQPQHHMVVSEMKDMRSAHK